jgi:hypothetical protein
MSTLATTQRKLTATLRHSTISITVLFHALSALPLTRRCRILKISQLIFFTSTAFTPTRPCGMTLNRGCQSFRPRPLCSFMTQTYVKTISAHGHGLGVLGLGRNYSDALRKLSAPIRLIERAIASYRKRSFSDKAARSRFISNVQFFVRMAKLKLRGRKDLGSFERSYDRWILDRGSLRQELAEGRVRSLARGGPTFAIVMVADQRPFRHIIESIRSVARQSYQHWQL